MKPAEMNHQYGPRSRSCSRPTFGAGVFLTSAAETTTGADTNAAADEASPPRPLRLPKSSDLSPPGANLAPPGPIAEGPGSRVGPYTIIRKLGEGGMGIVFLAEQERPVRRMVALKVIKPGMNTEQFVARFEAERQALALMDHPGIARVSTPGLPTAACRSLSWNCRRRSDQRVLRPRAALPSAAARAFRRCVPSDPACTPEGDYPPRHQAIERACDA